VNIGVQGREKNIQVSTGVRWDLNPGTKTEVRERKKNEGGKKGGGSGPKRKNKTENPLVVFKKRIF